MTIRVSTEVGETVTTIRIEGLLTSGDLPDVLIDDVGFGESGMPELIRSEAAAHRSSTSSPSKA